MAKERGDYYSYAGAGMLVHKIEKYWKDRGYPLISAKRYEVPGCPGEWGVRSNLRPDGFPPGIPTKISRVKRRKKRVVSVTPLKRLERRGVLNVWELTAADTLIRAFRISVGWSAPRDPVLGQFETCTNGAEHTAVVRIDTIERYRRWRKDLAGTPALAAAVSLLFNEDSIRACERGNHWRNGIAREYLRIALRHFAALSGNAPRGAHDWRVRRKAA